MTTIVVGRNGKETIKNIVEPTDFTVEARFRLRSGNNVWRTNFEKQRRGYVPHINNGVVINWALQSDITGGDAIVYNADGILKASNKSLARRLMVEAGVSVPETTKSLVKADEWRQGGNVVIRRPVSHHGGLEFEILTNTLTRRPLQDYYYQKFFRKTKEFRVHSAHGKVLVMQEKVPREGVTVDYDNPAPWNHATGEFVFKTVRWSDYDYDTCRASVDAVRALGLDFGVVDILWNEEEGAVVCEVNTSPSLAEYSTGRYRMYFEWLSKSLDSKREHYDSSEFTCGKDFAWRNRELRDDDADAE